jgi:hypothetical protein
MKKVLLALFVLAIAHLSFGQNRCNRPLSSIEYNQKKQQVVATGNEARRLQMALRISQESCLTTTQVKDIAMTLNDEYNRLEYTEKAYSTVFDPENYYEVYDVFTKFSMAIRLYDFVNGRNTTTPTSPNPSNPTNPNPTSPTNGNYPNYNYPDFVNYTGQKNCGYPISEAIFEASMQRVRSQNEIAKTNFLRQFVQNNCLATSQVMKAVSLVGAETSRLEILRVSYDHIYDVNNFSAATQVFQQRANQDQLLAFINQSGGIGNPNTGGTCSVNDGEFNNILSTIRRENLTFNKFNITKNITKQYNCFSVEQVRTIVKEFNTESYKLDIAKYLYDYTNPAERRQYFMVGNEFMLSSTRNDLSNFLAQKGN